MLDEFQHDFPPVYVPIEVEQVRQVLVEFLVLVGSDVCEVGVLQNLDRLESLLDFENQNFGNKVDKLRLGLVFFEQPLPSDFRDLRQLHFITHPVRIFL